MSRLLFINGQWVEGSGESFTSLNPSDGSDIWTGTAASQEDVALAFKAAREAFDGWSRTPLAERMTIVKRYKELALAAKDSMGELIAKELSLIHI